MVDAYLWGHVSRISPEAPVPVVSISKRENRLGGAANVALNIVALGANPILCGVIGNDSKGESFLELLKESNLSAEGMVIDKTRKTTSKTRIISSAHHMLRVDEETTEYLDSTSENTFLEKISSLLNSKKIDVIILEDYNKGVLTSYLISSVMILAKFHGIPTSVDPKKDQFFSYRGCTLFKPNLKELKEGLKVEFDFKNDKDSFLKAVVELEERLENEISFITLSEYGVFIQAQGTPHFIPAHLRNIADVSGAGDTVIAVATLCLVAGASAAEIAAIANIAGGLVCEQPGVVSIEKERLLNEVNNLL